MTDIPIIFSAPMVQALLAGCKTMTRRLAWRSGWYCACDGRRVGSKKFNPSGIRVCPKCGASGGLIFNGGPSSWQKAQPGDRLWVRENFTLVGGGDPGIPIYAANWREDAKARGFDNIPATAPRWTPCIHMPRWVSRLTLVVTAVKIEPLWKISEEDATAEGCVAGNLGDGFGPRDFGGGYTVESPGTWASAAGMFQILWNSLHGEDAWETAAEADTEVVAITFTVHQSNVGALQVAT